MRALFRNKNSKAARSRRAVSPVIATVILVAIAITVSVAVAYWMGGIAGSFTQFEKVEIQSGVCAKVDATYDYWKITIKLKNTGTATATLIGVFVNEVEVDAYGAADPSTTGINGTIETSMGLALDPSYTIDSGATGEIEVYVACNYGSYTSGTTVNVKIHSAGGMDYIKLITLV
jgi:flagellin-like protein